MDIVPVTNIAFPVQSFTALEKVMKSGRINFIIPALLCVFLWVLTSCSEDEDYMIARFSYSCSPELLEFATPTIHYYDEDGTLQDIQLRKEQFTAHNNGSITVNITINGVTTEIKKEFTDNRWDFSKRYNGWTAKGKVWVTFQINDDINIYSDKTYVFYHYFSTTWNVYSEERLCNVYNKTYGIHETHVLGADVSEYLNSLTERVETLDIDIIATKKE